MHGFTRRDFVAASALAAGAAITGSARAAGSSDRKAIYKEIERRHDESVKRLQEWIGVGSIAAENVGMAEGCDMMGGSRSTPAFNVPNASRRRDIRACSPHSTRARGARSGCISCTT